jgi:glycosyltransferase involved in cell wall biosynthesis
MRGTGIKLLVIIPAFNEEANIGAVIAALRKDAPEADIVVVNDGSGDSTALVARSAGVGVLNHPYNMGVGAAMQTGYRYARLRGYDVAVQVDADGQHPTEAIARLVAPVVEGRADLVVGSRFLTETGYRPTLARAAGIALLSRVVSVVTGMRVTDPTSGFRAAGRRAIGFLSECYPDDYPEPESIVLLEKRGFGVIEVPVRMRSRAGGRSSITAAKSIYYMVKVLLAIFVDLLKRARLPGQ